MTHTADTVVAKASDSKFRPHPEGQFIGQCVDVIALGESVEMFPGQPQRLVTKCALVFRTGERNEEVGEFIDIGREFTVSMGEKANLRKFMEQWRGKPYTKEQIDDGVPLHKMLGQPGLLTIAHKVSQNNRTYANITACVGIPKQLMSNVQKYDGYTRADYWEEKKKAYAEAARKFKSEQAPPSNGEDFEDFPDQMPDGMDDPPF